MTTDSNASGHFNKGFDAVTPLKEEALTLIRHKPYTIPTIMTGIYIHIPFCKSKCPYCDFYSFTPDITQKDSYTEAVLSCLLSHKDKVKDKIDSVYFGGGTPSFLGGERIKRIIELIRDSYCLEKPEITVECNPSSVDESLALLMSQAGVNRVSMGMQSAVDRERKSLGRESDRAQLEKAVRLIKAQGITNISLDLMLGIPHQTRESLRESLDFATGLEVTHISAYMLKLEPDTPFAKAPPELPDEDEVCELYLEAAAYLEEKGYFQYEISNFAKKGFESRHNLRYWRCEEYLGVGPSAHSFLNGERFYYPRDFSAFLDSPTPIYDGRGGDEEEYIMLALRLNEGLTARGFRSRFGKDIPEEIYKKARKPELHGLLTADGEGIRLTREGFLLSNNVISSLLF